MVTPPTIAAALHAAIDEALKLFSSADERRTALRSAPDVWSAREVLGHLIDSACNNHRRFIVAQSGDIARFDGYDQNAWVSRQRYHDVPWRDLVALWTAYNRHLAHVIGCTPAVALAQAALSPDGSQTQTLAFVMEDYVHHLRHHLGQLKSLLAR
jgi:DinB superfamily